MSKSFRLAAESASHLWLPFSWSRLPQPIIIPSQGKTLLLWYILPVVSAGAHSGTVCKDPDLRYPGFSLLVCTVRRITPQICTRFCTIFLQTRSSSRRSPMFLLMGRDCFHAATVDVFHSGSTTITIPHSGSKGGGSKSQDQGEDQGQFNLLPTDLGRSYRILLFPIILSRRWGNSVQYIQWELIIQLRN